MELIENSQLTKNSHHWCHQATYTKTSGQLTLFFMFVFGSVDKVEDGNIYNGSIDFQVDRGEGRLGYELVTCVCLDSLYQVSPRRLPL